MQVAATISLDGIYSEFKQLLGTALTCKDILMVLASKAVRSRQIWWIPVRVEE